MPNAMVACRGFRILFVGGSNPLSEQDAQLIADLTIFEHTITVRSDAGVTIFDAIGKDLIIISESVESDEISTLFRYVPIPILTWEGWLQDDLGMTARGNSDDDTALVDTAQLMTPRDKDEGAYGEMIGETKIRIIIPEHPLAAGYNGVIQTTTNGNNRFHWGKPNENATIVATAQNKADRAMLYSYDDGARMVGLRAPARRVFLHSATAPDLTAEGLVLFLTAVHWAQGCLDGTSPEPTATATATGTVPSLPTMTGTPTAMPTPSPTSTASPMPTNTATSTSTPMPTATSTSTSTPSPMPTISATATASPAATVSPTASATPIPATFTPTPTATTTVDSADIKFEKRDLLFIDSDENGVVSTGDTLLYTIVMENRSSAPIQEIQLEDTPDGRSRLIAGTVQSAQGTVITGNQGDDSALQVRMDMLTGGAAVQVTFQVEILPANTTTVGQLQNQATLRFSDSSSSPSGQQVIFSDDPDTSMPGDSTTTPLNVGGTEEVHQLYLPVVIR